MGRVCGEVACMFSVCGSKVGQHSIRITGDLLYVRSDVRGKLLGNEKGCNEFMSSLACEVTHRSPDRGLAYP